jgi:hypothetical protein
LKPQFILTACLLFIGIIGSAAARAQNDESLDKLIRASTISLFDLLPKNDFDAVRALMSDDLAVITSAKGWENIRKEIVSKAGSTPRYVAYQTTYYEQDPPVAAVDFFGKSAKKDTYVCGFVAWTILDTDDVRFIRLEENVVSVPVFKSMPQQQAAQLLTDFRCPVRLIEEVLGVTVQ